MLLLVLLMIRLMLFIAKALERLPRRLFRGAGGEIVKIAKKERKEEENCRYLRAAHEIAISIQIQSQTIKHYNLGP